MDIYIVDAKRIATGAFLKSLNKIHPAEYGSEIVKNIVRNNNINSDEVDELICGNVLSAGLKQNLARQISIQAGLAESVCATSLNMLCGSGIKAIMQAYLQIKAGFSSLVIAGGAESMSYSPYLDLSARNGARLQAYKIEDHIIKDALTDAFYDIHMGVTAENIAKEYQISRKEQDDFALNSQTKALKAIEDGKFKDEIVPFTISNRQGTRIFDTDEYPNANTSSEKLASLKPAFIKDGSVTAGNASGINDGAAFCLIASSEVIKKKSLKPLVKIIGINQGGVDPRVMGLGPVPAIKNLFANSKVSFNDVDIIELNEAFAAQSLGVIKQLAQDFNMSEKEILAKTNPNGGAIALGHPLGASGARILTTLIYELKRTNKRYGLASLCIGGGMGVAILVENIEWEN